MLSKPKTTTYGLNSFLTFQLSSGMHCRTFFTDFKTKTQDVTFI